MPVDPLHAPSAGTPRTAPDSRAPLLFPSATRTLTWNEARGQAELRVSPGGVLLLRASGLYTAELGRKVTVAMKTYATRGPPLTIFCDWGEMQDFEPGARFDALAFATQHKEHVVSHLILVNSKLIALAVASAGLLLSLQGVRLRTTHKEADFLKALRAALAPELSFPQP